MQLSSAAAEVINRDWDQQANLRVGLTSHATFQITERVLSVSWSAVRDATTSLDADRDVMAWTSSAPSWCAHIAPFQMTERTPTEHLRPFEVLPIFWTALCDVACHNTTCGSASETIHIPALHLHGVCYAHSACTIPDEGKGFKTAPASFCSLCLRLLDCLMRCNMTQQNA